MQKRTIKFTLLFVLLGLIVIPLLTFCYLLFVKSLVPAGKTAALIVPPGATIYQVALQLEKQKIYNHPHLLTLITAFRGDAGRLRYGQYLITNKLNIIGLLNNMLSGTGLVKHKITFVEGWTFKEIRQALSRNPNLQHLIKNDSSDKQIMQMLKISNDHPEGLFFPDTYVFNWGNTDISLLQKAYAKMQSILKQQWQQRASNLPYATVYQALIVASMIEKETAIEKDRPKIAGVIIQRLRKHMRLQVDPTVLYGLGKAYGTTITKDDLRSETPYNTYWIYGLPPTPIDMPSLSSLKAALHPEITQALYYVARGDGTHEFSATYAEHLVAVKRYRHLEKEVELLEQLPEKIEETHVQRQSWFKEGTLALRTWVEVK